MSYDGSVGRRDHAVVRQGAARSDLTVHVDVVLDHEGDAGERPRVLTALQVAVETGRFGQCVLRVHVDEGVHGRVHLTDQLQVSNCNLLGGELAREHQPGDLSHREPGDLAIVP